MKKEKLLERVTKHYLNSRDFNGFPLSAFKSEKENIVALIREGKIEINFGDNHPNPHIKAFDLGNKNEQFLKIESLGFDNSCAYPTKEHLKTVVTVNEYEGRPFTLKLALGEPQLGYSVFDLSVLECYRNDPRYSYSNDDIQGFISVSDEYYESSKMKSSDKILLQSFGFCYEKGTMNRAVAIFNTYLADLTPEHQQVWNAKLLTGEYSLHPDYERSSGGSFYERESVFIAFVEELHTINEFSKLMGRPILFHESYRENKPKEFGFLIRPTLKEFNSFVHLLDKLISKNINRDFFQHDIPYEKEVVRNDGKMIVNEKGSLTLLKEWLSKKVYLRDPKPAEEMIRTFQQIRRMRMPPAHEIDEDKFDQEYLKKQRELMVNAYSAIRTLRLIFANHPATKAYKVPEWLFKGEIWTF